MKSGFRNLISELQFLIIIISMIIVIVTLGISLFIISSNMLEDLRSHSISTADEMEALLEYPLYAVDDEQAARICETFLSSGKVSGVELESAANGVILSKIAEKKSSRIPRISRDISRDGLLLGKITLTFSDHEINSTQSRFGIIALIIIITVLLANIAANRLIIARRIRKPFNAIISAIQKLSEGDYKTQIDKTSYRDLNVLVSFFNDMADKVLLKSQEQKEIEEALRESERKARAILDLSLGFIGLLTPDGSLIEANRTALDFAGVRPEDVAGKPFWETPWWTHSPDMQKRLREAVRLAARGELVRFEATNMDLEGALHTFDFSLKPIKDETGNVIMLLPEGHDVTERNKAEEALYQSEKRFRSIIQESMDIIVILDKNGNVTYESPSTSVILGYSPGYWIGRSPMGSIHPEDLPSVQRDLKEVFAGVNDGRPTVFRIKRADEAWIHLEAVGNNQFQNPSVQGVVITLREITDRIIAEEEKEKLLLQLYQSQKMESVGRLAGGVAHDFNNMLSAILGHSELAMMKTDQSDQICGDLKAIQTAAQRSADLTRQLLAFARKQTVLPRVLDLNDTIAGMLKMLVRLIGEDIDLVWMPGKGLWPVRIDPSQIDQMLVNLCINARDAIKGTGKITIESENTSFDKDYCSVHPGFVPGEYVMMAVSDNGAGMSKEVLEHLFEPFYTTKEVGKGTGLGLATIYGIVKQNNGFLNVYSEPGAGTTFKIYLPREMGASLETLPETVFETPMGHEETILLVEDEPTILDVTRAMLEKLGYRVLATVVPLEALRLSREHDGDINLMITDVVMPEMNGKELFGLISEIRTGLKCLFISGYTANTIARHGVLDQGVHFIQKPFSMHDLAVKVREALGD